MALARAVQAELDRVGCDPGPIDGNWGAKAKQALSRFARQKQLELAIDKPTQAALQALAGQSGRICTRGCRANETEVGGRCVATRPEPRKPQANHTPPKAAVQPVKAKPASSSGEKCMPRTDIPGITGTVPCGSPLSSGNRPLLPPTR
jgi:hypothetical protein